MSIAASVIGRLLRRPVRIWHQGEPVTDEWGQARPGHWSATDTLAYLEQTTTAEVVVGQEVYQADWLLVLAPGTPLEPWDRVEVPDIPATFEVIGLPNRRRRPQVDREHHVEARVRFVNNGTGPPEGE